MKRVMITILVLLPISSVLFCLTLFVMASKGESDLLPTPKNALSKTSWERPDS